MEFLQLLVFKHKCFRPFDGLLHLKHFLVKAQPLLNLGIHDVYVLFEMRLNQFWSEQLVLLRSFE